WTYILLLHGVECARKGAAMAVPGRDQSFKSAKPTSLVARVTLLALAVLIAEVCHAAMAQAKAPPKRSAVLAADVCPAVLLPRFATSVGTVVDALAERGWIEGRNLIVDCVATGGHIAQIPALAAELVGRKPNVLVGASTTAVRALKQASSKIPIVTV